MPELGLHSSHCFQYTAGATQCPRQLEVEVISCPLKPRSQALSLASSSGSSDLGYESDWEYCDSEAEDEDDEWEYFFEVPRLALPGRDLQQPYSSQPLNWSPGPEGEKIAASLTAFLARMKDKESRILFELEEEFQASSRTASKVSSEKSSSAPSLRPSIAKFTGSLDTAGRPHGPGDARLTNGSTLSATFRHGLAHGPGVLELLNGDRYEGNFVSDKLTGWVTETYQETGWRQTFYQAGARAGYYRDVSPCGSYLEFGVEGQAVWRLREGNCLLIGRKDADGQLTDQDTLYLYPGFLLAIFGSFKRGKMMTGRECVPTSLKFDSFGLPNVTVTPVTNSRLLTFENPGTHIPAKHCSVRDLWDMLHVYVRHSAEEGAGEGLFARRDIKQGQLVALFSGARKRHFRNESFEWSDYCIKLDESCSIDIPDYYISVEHYSATLAHKVTLSLSLVTCQVILSGLSFL